MVFLQNGRCKIQGIFYCDSTYYLYWYSSFYFITIFVPRIFPLDYKSQTLFYISKSEIIDTLKSGLTDEESDMLNKKLTKKLYKEKEVNLKFTKAPIRKNSKEISYNIKSQLPIETTDETKNLFATQYKLKDDKLNFYKK